MSGKRFACLVLLLGMPAQLTNAQAYDPAAPRGDSRMPEPINDRWTENEAAARPGVADYLPSDELTKPRTQVGPKPTVTRQRAFAIPFTLSSTQDRDQPAEVRLFVSGDQGANWSLYQRQPPTVDRFHFRAGQDGEFWFVVRTVGRLEEPVSVRDQQPELVVIVDTAEPAIQLAAVPGEYGGVRVDWKATDRNLAAHSFRLQYRTGPNETWQIVEVGVPDPDDWRQEFTGTADWWLKASQESVQVRAEVLDRAGNSSVVDKTVALPLVASASPANQESLAASGNRGMNQLPQDNEAWPSVGGQSSRDWWRRGPRQNDAAGGLNREPGSSPFQAASDITRQLPRLDADAVNAQSSISEGFASTGEGRTYDSTLDDPPIATEPIQDDPIAPVRSELAPPVAHQYQPEPAGAGLDQPRRMTTSPRFQLEYDLIDVGPRGVTRVELWYTTDQARTWRLYGHDPDNQSPFDVQVQPEGLYGFRMAVYSNSASSAAAPARWGRRRSLGRSGLDQTDSADHIRSAHRQRPTDRRGNSMASQRRLAGRPAHHAQFQRAAGRSVVDHRFGPAQLGTLRVADRPPAAKPHLPAAGSPRSSGQYHDARAGPAGGRRQPHAERPHPRRASDRRSHTTANSLVSPRWKTWHVAIDTGGPLVRL